MAVCFVLMLDLAQRARASGLWKLGLSSACAIVVTYPFGMTILLTATAGAVSIVFASLLHAKVHAIALANDVSVKRASDRAI